MKRNTLIISSCAVLGVGLLLGFLGGRWHHGHHLKLKGSEMLTTLPHLHRFPMAVEDPPSPLVTAVNQDLKGWSGRALAIRAATQDLPEDLKRIAWKQLAGPGRVKFEPQDQLDTKATFDAPGDYLLRLTATDGAEEVTRDIAARVMNAPFDLWKKKKFSAAMAMDPVMTGDRADPDRDGIPNLIEYALMLNPEHSDVAGLPDPSVRKGKVHLTYRRPASAVDVHYQVQWSDDMKTWHNDGIEEQIIVSVGDLQVIQASTAQSSESAGRFLRLQIVGPE